MSKEIIEKIALETSFKRSEAFSERPILQMPENEIYKFLPWLLKGFEHFYGDENIDYIKSKLERVVFFPYFLRSKDIESDLDIELVKLVNKLENLASEQLDEETKGALGNMVKVAIIQHRVKSCMQPVTSEKKDTFYIVMLEMSEKEFYPKLIHECVHVIDTIISEDDKCISGFSGTRPGTLDTLFNEYFTEKISVDIFNYLLQDGCPMLSGKEVLYKDFSISPYMAPENFMHDFYEIYKNEICTCKLYNSLQIFSDVLGMSVTEEVLNGCNFIYENSYYGASKEQLNEVISVSDRCKEIVANALGEHETK